MSETSIRFQGLLHRSDCCNPLHLQPHRFLLRHVPVQYNNQEHQKKYASPCPLSDGIYSHRNPLRILPAEIQLHHMLSVPALLHSAFLQPFPLHNQHHSVFPQRWLLPLPVRRSHPRSHFLPFPVQPFLPLRIRSSLWCCLILHSCLQFPFLFPAVCFQHPSDQPLPDPELYPHQKVLCSFLQDYPVL